ncbi:hypothetical protein EJP02_024 [Escherichia phage EJP2]|nr:hypothetical protein EJP02_024 [Escherichia phage EJP2]
MFTINSYADVLVLAKTFGNAALDYALQNGTIQPEQCRLIGSCKRWAVSNTIALENFNDGNNEYSVDAVFEAVDLGGIYNTNLNDVRIVRTGFGAYDLSIREAMDTGYISKDVLAHIMQLCVERNEARTILGL